MLETPLRWWQQLYGKGSCVVWSLSLNGTCQFAKSFTLLKQQLYAQIIHAETKHAPLGSQLRQFLWSTWVIKYIFRNWPKHPCIDHRPVFFINCFCCKECVNNLVWAVWQQFSWQLCLDVDLRYSTWLSNNYFYANPMDICVLSRVGGFRLGKLVSILSNENKQMKVAFTHIHKRCLCRTLYDVVGNALDRLITIGS